MTRRQRSILVVVCFAVAACSSTPTPVARPAAAPVRCTTHQTCGKLDGERVEVIGTYTPWTDIAGRPAYDDRVREVKITLDGGIGGPFLEAEHDRRRMRSHEEMATFRDRRVRIVGRYRRAQACICDVESIELAE